MNSEEQSEPEVLFHYAVWKRGDYLEPACVSSSSELIKVLRLHGITINRGDVNCTECLRMMGGD